MSGDAVGELKLKVFVELDVDEVKAEQQQAADASVSIWERAAETIRKRNEDAQVAAAVELQDRGVDTTGIEDPAAHLAALKAREDAAKQAANSMVADANRVKAAEKKSADDTKKAWEDAFKDIGDWIRGAALATSAAVGLFVHSTVEASLSIDRQSRSLGLSRREVQQWQYVAGQAGVESENFGQAVAGLAQRAANAAQHGGDAAAQFRHLGISIKDSHGNLLPTNELMMQAADALAAMPDGAGRTAAAMSLFGEQGRQLLPVLSQGRSGLQRMTGEFDRLGGGLNDETIDAVVEAQRSMERLKTQVQSALAPSVGRLVEWLTKAATKLHDLATNSTAPRAALAALAVGVGLLARRFLILKAEAIATWIATFAPAILGAAAIAVVVLIVDDLINMFTGGQSVIGEFIDQLFGVGTAEAVVNSLKEKWDALVDTLSSAVDKVKEFFGYDAEIAVADDAALAAQRVRQNAYLAAQDHQRQVAAGVAPAPARRAGGARVESRPGPNSPVVTASPTAAATAERAARPGPTTVNSRRTVTINGVVTEERLRPMIESVMAETNGADAAAALDGLAETR